MNRIAVTFLKTSLNGGAAWKGRTSRREMEHPSLQLIQALERGLFSGSR